MKIEADIKNTKLNQLYGKKNLPFFQRPYFPLLCMTVPFFLLILIFNYAPLWGWLIAFQDYTPGVSVFSQDFVGLKNFIRLVGSQSDFLMVLRNTLAMSILNLMTTPLVIIFAIMISEVRNGFFRRTVQTISSFPHFISWVVVYSIFYVFFSIDDGILNRILLSFHLIESPTNLLGNENITWFLQTFLSLWKNCGWNAIIYIAAITSIDAELYNAAMIDGAGRLKRIWHITIPGIMPTFVTLMIISIGYLINAGFDQYYVFGNPLIMDKINVIDTYAYTLGIQEGDISFSVAVSMFKSVVSIVLVFVANFMSKRFAGRGIMN